VALAIGWCVANRAGKSQALVQRFTEMLDHGNVTGAAALTSYPSAAADSIRQLVTGMSPGRADYRPSQVINLSDTDAFFTVNATWHFGPDRNWAYSVQGTARKLAVGWRISWDPQLLLPGLGRGRTGALVRTYAPSPRVTAAGGVPLMSEQTVNMVEFDAAHAADRVASATSLANALVDVAPLVTPQSILAAADAAHNKPITAVVLRDDVDEVVEPALDGIPGVAVRRQPKLITLDRRIWSPLLDTMTTMWQNNRLATSGWAVRVFDPEGDPVGQLSGHQGPPGPDIACTMDPRVQLAAEDAVVGADTAASIVAIRPSTGAVLAVAQNDQADAQGPIAFTALLPAGNSMDLFTAGAAAATAAAPQHVSGQDVRATLRALGIGIDPRVPGLTATTGRVPVPRPIEAVAQDSRDETRVSPFGMALAAATIANGTRPVPMIVLGERGVPSGPALPQAAIDRMRQMLAQSAADPEFAVHLAAYPGLVGYTADAGDDQWFIGYRGDLAFSIHIANTAADGGDAAARMAGWMFQALDQPQ